MRMYATSCLNGKFNVDVLLSEKAKKKSDIFCTSLVMTPPGIEPAGTRSGRLTIEQSRWGD